MNSRAAGTSAASDLPPVMYYVCPCCATHAGADEGSKLVPNEWIQCRTCGYRCSCYGCLCEAEPA